MDYWDRSINQIRWNNLSTAKLSKYISKFKPKKDNELMQLLLVIILLYQKSYLLKGVYISKQSP